MTDIHWTEKAIDLLDGLEREDQQRLISKLEEAQDWTEHRLDKLSGYPYTNSALAITARSSPGIESRMS